MPFKITVMGVTGNRVTFGISATFRGSPIPFDRTTFSMEVGEELNLVMNAKFENGTVTEEGELQVNPNGLSFPGVQTLYKIEAS